MRLVSLAYLKMKILDERTPTPVQQIKHPLFDAKKITLYIKREDLVHPEISGNKWYKLKHNLRYAKSQGIRRLISFGGAYSNHLHALAYAGHALGLETVGFIRGERREPLNPTLKDAEAWGMSLRFLPRSDYRRRHDQDFVAHLTKRLEPCLVIPEGGANSLALLGCGEIVEGIYQQLESPDYLCVPCGTGATLAGIVNAVDVRTKVLGFPALKGVESLQHDIHAMLAQCGYNGGVDWRLIDRFHCGGFAKVNSELARFMDGWCKKTGVALEPVYTGKMMMGVCQLAEEGYFPSGTQVVAVHTGGMQGLRGLEGKLQQLLGN